MDKTKSKIRPYEKRPTRLSNPQPYNKKNIPTQNYEQNLPQPKKSALILLSSIAKHSVNHSPPKSNKFKNLISSQLFKQTIFRVKMVGLTDQQIDLELRRNAALAEFMPQQQNQDFSYLYTDSHQIPMVKIDPKCDEIKSYITNFDPAAVFTLDPEKQKNIFHYWIDYQRGKLSGMEEMFEVTAYNTQIGIESLITLDK